MQIKVTGNNGFKKIYSLPLGSELCVYDKLNLDRGVVTELTIKHANGINYTFQNVLDIELIKEE